MEGGTDGSHRDGLYFIELLKDVEEGRFGLGATIQILHEMYIQQMLCD